jgi:DNA transformation protein
MVRDAGFHEYVMSEVFQDIPDIHSRSMFGGWGVYQDGVFFALISDGRLYFKVDSSNKADFEKAGSSPFVYEARGKKTTMSYYELPVEITEDLEEIPKWVERSVEVAKKSKKKK